MIVTINRAEFLDAAKRAASIAPSESPLDVLKGALMEADAASGKLTITSTNMEVSLEEKLPCSVQEEGSLVFSARMLTEMLQRLPLDTVQISRPDNHGRMALRSENACYEVDVWDRGSFPKPDLPFPEDTVKLSGIPAMAQRTVFATAQDNNKPLLKCVNLKFTNVGLRAAGSNGNCIVTAKGDDQSKGDISLLIPATSLGKLARMCADKDEFRVGTTGKNIVFFKENFLFSARLMEGGYIDTDLLLSTIKNSFTVLTDIQDLRNALSSVLTVEPEGRVRLGFKDQRLEFYCGGAVRLVSASKVYGPAAAARLGIERQSFYQCQNCNARVGCHPGSTRPLGNLANEALRMKRMETHHVFDSFWKERGMSRTQAYKWMAKKMRLSEELAHIGGFEIDRCQKLIKLCEKERNKEQKQKKEAA